MFFKPEDIEKLIEGLAKVGSDRDNLVLRYLAYPYRTAIAEEHAKHGFSRRVSTMRRCIENVFSVIPPDLDRIPSKDDTNDAVIAIQALVMNTFGCIENLAWIWAHEASVAQADGSPLEPKMIGLRAQNKAVWNSMRPEFRKYLVERRPWFAHLTNFRDALAHRIPLYIPPYAVDPKNFDKYREYEKQATDAIKAMDMEKYDSLMTEQRKLCFFRPWMTHSFAEKARHIVFHPQILADYNTVIELGGKMADELDLLKAPS